MRVIDIESGLNHAEKRLINQYCLIHQLTALALMLTVIFVNVVPL